MENHHQEPHFLLRKIASVFPSSLSSCQFRALPDVAEPSIPKKTIHHHPHHQNAEDNISSAAFKKPKQINRYKCPQVTPVSGNPKGMFKQSERIGRRSNSVPQSSSANSGLFSSSETDTFFSFSTNSGDSFRLKTLSQRFKKCEEMKSIDETGRFSYSSFDTQLSKSSRKTVQNPTSTNRVKRPDCKHRGLRKCSKIFPEYELGSDQISAQVYYSKTKRATNIEKKPRRMRMKKQQKKKKKAGLIEESYAVEKSSSDVRGDFRESMVEMIVQKQMFGAEDLQRLLHCFLSLNSSSYHGVILDVFQEICETLFTN